MIRVQDLGSWGKGIGSRKEEREVRDQGIINPKRLNNEKHYPEYT